MLAFEALAEHEGVLGADGDDERGTEAEAFEEGEKGGHVPPYPAPTPGCKALCTDPPPSRIFSVLSLWSSSTVPQMVYRFDSPPTGRP
jgi:hypothetical protein